MRANVARIGIGAIAAMLAIGAGGCWLYAIQFAPAGIQLATGTGSAVAGAVARATGHAPGPKGDCAALQGNDVSIIELRIGAASEPQYRELRVDDSGRELRWAPVVGSETDANGWRPAINFIRMNFTPPLQNAIPKTGTSFLAYTSSEIDSFNDDDRLRAFGRTFGEPVGSFRWGEHVYVYALPPALPCFSPPS